MVKYANQTKIDKKRGGIINKVKNSENEVTYMK